MKLDIHPLFIVPMVKLCGQNQSFFYLQPPSIKRQHERPKKKRNKEAGEMVKDETQPKHAKFGIKCSRWHMDGHNKAICKMPMHLA